MALFDWMALGVIYWLKKEGKAEERLRAQQEAEAERLEALEEEEEERLEEEEWNKLLDEEEREDEEDEAWDKLLDDEDEAIRRCEHDGTCLFQW